MKAALTKAQARRRVQRQTKLLILGRPPSTAHEDAEQVLKKFDQRINKAKEALSDLSKLAWRCVS